MKKICIIQDTGNGRLGGHFSWLAFQGLPGVEIAAIADENPETVSPGSGAKRLYRDWRAMMEKERPDVTVLTSRLPEDHERQIRFAAEHGSHVLCEKPLVADLRTGEELLSLSEKNRCLIQVLHLARFAPVFREMKRLLQSGELGKPLSCLLRGKEDSRGGGEDLMVLGSHLLDLAVFLFGPPENVFAAVEQDGRPLRAEDRLPTEEPLGLCAGDEVFARFRMPGNVSAVFESRRNMVKRGECIRMGIAVTGTKGSAAVRYAGERTLRLSRNFPVPPEDEAHFEEAALPPEPEIPGAEPPDLKDVSPERRYFLENNRRAAWNLLQAAEGKEELVSSGREALISLAMIQGIYRSSLEERVIRFPLEEKRHPLSSAEKKSERKERAE